MTSPTLTLNRDSHPVDIENINPSETISSPSCEWRGREIKPILQKAALVEGLLFALALPVGAILNNSVIQWGGVIIGVGAFVTFLFTTVFPSNRKEDIDAIIE